MKTRMYAITDYDGYQDRIYGIGRTEDAAKVDALDQPGFKNTPRMAVVPITTVEAIKVINHQETLTPTVREILGFPNIQVGNC